MCQQIDRRVSNSVNKLHINDEVDYQYDGYIGPLHFSEVDLTKRYKVLASNAALSVAYMDYRARHLALLGDSPEISTVGVYSIDTLSIIDDLELLTLFNWLNWLGHIHSTIDRLYYFYEVPDEEWTPFFEEVPEYEPEPEYVALNMAYKMVMRHRIKSETYGLLNSGHSINVRRYGTERNPNKFTIVDLSVEHGQITGTGVSALHPKDTPNKEAGVLLALNRAIINLDENI